MKFGLVILSLLISLHALASRPPVESLFRNGSNKDVSANTISLTFSIQELKIDSDEQTRISEFKDADIAEKIKREGDDLFKQYAQIYFIVDSNEQVHFIQSLFENSSLNIDSLKDVYFKRNFLSSQINKSELEPNKDIFYSSLSTLVLNNSDLFSSLFKRAKANYRTNQELLNSEKMGLLARYKKYLEDISRDPSLEKVLTSPLKPESTEEQRKINEILRSDMYSTSQNVSLKKQKDRFYWQVDLGNIVSKFNYENHQILDLKYLDGRNPIEVRFDQYLLFNGAHSLPKFVTIKTDDNRIYMLQMLTLRHFNTSSSFFRRKLKKLNDQLKKVGYSIQKPSFTY